MLDGDGGEVGGGAEEAEDTGGVFDFEGRESCSLNTSLVIASTNFLRLMDNSVLFLMDMGLCNYPMKIDSCILLDALNCHRGKEKKITKMDTQTKVIDGWEAQRLLEKALEAAEMPVAPSEKQNTEIQDIRNSLVRIEQLLEKLIALSELQLKAQPKPPAPKTITG